MPLFNRECLIVCVPVFITPVDINKHSKGAPNKSFDSIVITCSINHSEFVHYICQNSESGKLAVLLPQESVLPQKMCCRVLVWGVRPRLLPPQSPAFKSICLVAPSLEFQLSALACKRHDAMTLVCDVMQQSPALQTVSFWVD